MVSLTVGYVSGIIAAAHFAFHILLPNAAVLILVATIGKEQNAVTWSAIQRQLTSSAWPSLLGTDATVSEGIKFRIRLATWLPPICFIVLTAAAIVTPLGLYDTVAPLPVTQFRTFSYVPDTGPMGYGTPPRSDLGFSRSCGDYLPLACPGTSVDITYSYNKTSGIAEANITNDNYDMRIPKVLANLYQSGLADQQQSVSSFFDIQFRQYTYMVENGVEHGKRYLVNIYRQLNTLVLNDDFEAVEGLIVDMKNGGVGFRNHTIPDEIQYGAEWSEDILFIEPETACINTNVTREFMAPWSSFPDGAENITLVDQGGFAHINTTYPRYDFSDSQSNPMLLERAYKAAWLTNAYNMLYFNLTRPSPHAFSYLKSEVGQHYPINVDYFGLSSRTFSITSNWEDLVNPQLYQTNNTSPTATLTNYRNPFNITLNNYTDISILCEGAGGLDLANISNIAVECGLVYGVAKRKDGVDSLIFEPGTWWSQPIYTCASANKALIKTVQFKYNTTLGEGLKGLQVVDIANKVYSNNSEKPLWGVENPQMTLSDISPLWGLISSDLEHSVNLSTVRSERLYLPGYTLLSESTDVPGYQFVPGTDGPSASLSSTYDVSGSNSDSGVADYSGTFNQAMLSKWQQYSSNASTTSKILNLVWTDITANALLGTKSWNSGRNLPSNLQKRAADTTASSTESSASLPVRVPVIIYTYQIRYTWIFGIPAAILMVLALLVLSIALAFTLSGYATRSRVREYLFHLSAGRLLAKQVYPGHVDGQAPTKIWVAGVGRKHIRLHSDGAVATDAVSTNITNSSAGDLKEDSTVGRGSTTGDAKFVKAGADASTKEVARSPPVNLASQRSYGMSRGYIELENRVDNRNQYRVTAPL
jgi:hypothetical protein